MRIFFKFYKNFFKIDQFLISKGFKRKKTGDIIFPCRINNQIRLFRNGKIHFTPIFFIMFSLNVSGFDKPINKRSRRSISNPKHG